SYIRAIRWGSDRIGTSGGVMAYVTGSAWIERGFADGLRKCLADEYSCLYVFHLRGDIRKNMLSKGRAREGGNVFGSGSMTGVAVSVFVKNPEGQKRGEIFFCDVGPDLTSEEKLSTLRDLGSIGELTKQGRWTKIEPDDHGDWINKRDKSFDKFIKI